MIVISRNGKTTVVRGWRAWLVGALVAAMTTLIALCAFLALGIALTTLTMLVFIAVPVAIGVTLLASLLRSRS
jgi:hypothetical protein